jgi:hypothetical protein
MRSLNTYTNQQLFAVSLVAVKREKANPPDGFVCRARVKLRDHAKLEHFVQLGVDFACQNGGNIVDLHRKNQDPKAQFQRRTHLRT